MMLWQAVSIWTLAMAAPAVPGASVPPEAAVRGSSPAGTADATRQQRERATADDLLRELQSSRPSNALIPPASARGRSFPPVEPELLPEGWTVVDVSGRLERGDAWWMFAADSPEFERPIKLLPNASLEVMVRTAKGARSPVGFVISGETTVFRGENYLLVRTVRRVAARSAPLEAEAVPDVGEPASDAVPDDAPVDDVLAVLRAREPAEPLLTAGKAGEPAAPRREVAYPAGLIPDGSLVTSRSGRVVRQDGWWVFVLTSDHPEHRDPPLKLLPNLTTELMAAAAETAGVGQVYLVSGEVTVFEGENYLLPRFATRRMEMGNLRP